MINDKRLMINNQKGTTLIEFLLAALIVAIIMGISFLGYRQRGQELGLQRAAYKVMTDIEKVREMAMSAHKQEGTGEVPEGGYGIYFNISSPDSYIVFADLGPVPDMAYSGSSEIVETISLEEQIEIDIVNPGNPVNVVFVPPSPDVYLRGGTAVNQVEVEIIISLSSDSSKTKTIYVNKAGLISVSN